MYNRKKFIQRSGILLVGGIALANRGAASVFNPFAISPIGLQLFTLFNVIDNDVSGSLSKVASIGYKEIESAFSKKGGYYGMKPKEFKALVKNLGMSWKSHHVLGAPFKMPPGAKPLIGADGKPFLIPPMKNLKDNFQELVDEAAEGGVEYLVCANTPLGNKEEIKSSIETLNKTGEACKKAGLLLAYHNHETEFKETDGVMPYYLLLSDTNADEMKMELDLAWASKAGVDPVELFKKHPGRFHLWHVKDMDKDLKNIQPVGNGVIDFKRIFANASTAGMKHFFVEHDMPADPFGSIAISYNNLNKLLSA